MVSWFGNLFNRCLWVNILNACTLCQNLSLEMLGLNLQAYIHSIWWVGPSFGQPKLNMFGTRPNTNFDLTRKFGAPPKSWLSWIRTKISVNIRIYPRYVIYREAWKGDILNRQYFSIFRGRDHTEPNPTQFAKHYQDNFFFIVFLISLIY